jgi:hypothetical protein
MVSGPKGAPNRQVSQRQARALVGLQPGWTELIETFCIQRHAALLDFL